MAYVIVNEVDLVLSCGYNEDVGNRWNLLPIKAQTMMMSVTLTQDEDTLINLFRKDFSVLDLTQVASEGGFHMQFVLRYVKSS